MKRHAYVLREGETHLPESMQKAFDNGRKVRDILKANIKAGRTAGETFDLLNQHITDAGFKVMATANTPTDDPDDIDISYWLPLGRQPWAWYRAVDCLVQS